MNNMKVLKSVIYKYTRTLKEHSYDLGATRGRNFLATRNFIDKEKFYRQNHKNPDSVLFHGATKQGNRRVDEVFENVPKERPKCQVNQIRLLA